MEKHPPKKEISSAETTHRRRLHHEVHGDVYEFLHQPWHLTIFMIIMAVVVMILAQILYPPVRTVPFTTIQGQDMGGMTQLEISRQLHDRYDNQEFEVVADEEVLARAQLDAMGLVPNYGEMVDKAVEYPIWQRLIPFSLFAKHWFEGDLRLQFSAYDRELTEFVETEVMPKCSTDAVSAVIEVKDGNLALEPGHAGRKCRKDEIIAFLRQLQLDGNSTKITLPYERIEPQRSREQVEALFQQAQETVDAVTLKADDKTFEAPREEVITWLTFEENDKKELQLGVNEGRVRDYLNGVNGEFATPAEPARAELQNGEQREVSAGTEGRELDIDTTLRLVKEAILEGRREIEMAVVTVAPETIYDRQYSTNDAGLEALLHDLVRQKGDYGITVIELDGQQRRANAYGSQSYTTASTYKIFVAYSVLKAMEAGRIHPGQHIRDGMSFEACWDEMLKYSLNPCSWTFADMVGGWPTIQQQIHAQGMTSTFLNGYDKRSTANDEALYFAKLETGELLQGESRERLLNTLKNQIYKTGIPAGAGYPAANKVGFYNGYLHDIGIVYAPQGRYVLAVMTHGGSWWGIADVARQVQDFLAQ